jgi:subtilisin family serine protease
LVTSTNAGTIHVFAAHNQRLAQAGGYVTDVNENNVFDPDVDYAYDADANKRHALSIQETITVAALASSGIYANYSNFGANVFVTAPSSSFRPGEFAITTTDRTGGAIANGGYNNSLGNADFDDFPDLDYNSTFGGTSSATPLVAGILALAKQAQPVTTMVLNVDRLLDSNAYLARVAHISECAPPNGCQREYRVLRSDTPTPQLLVRFWRIRAWPNAT